MEVKVVTAQMEHIPWLSEHIRESDRQEVWATACLSPIDALTGSLKVSARAWTGLVDGEPVCMFGVAPSSLLTETGRPWMLGTDALDNYAMAFLRRNKRKVNEMLQLFPRLVNYVDVRNEKSVRWLVWLGFELGEPVAYGVLKRPFMKFTMER